MPGGLQELTAIQDILNFCRSLVERSPLALALTEGPAHVVRYGNAAFSRLTGKGLDSLLGRALPEALPPLCRKDASALLEHAYRTGEPRSLEDLAGITLDEGAPLWSVTAWPLLESSSLLLVAVSDGARRTQEHRRDRELAEEMRQVNERLVIAGVKMQELAEEAETARRRMALLAEVGRLLGTEFEPSSMLPAIAQLLVREVCDHCALHVATTPDRAFRSVTAPEAPSPQAARVVEHLRKTTLERGQALLCTSTPDARSGEPEIAGALREIGFASSISVPLMDRTCPCGVLTVLDRGRRYEPADVTLVSEIADRIALGIDRAALYQQALDAARARDDLIAVVSHDLKNPLTAILLSTSLLARSGASCDGAKSGALNEAGESPHVERIQRSAKHMLRLIQDLVDSAKIDAGRFLVERQRHALSTVVAEGIEMLTPVAANKSLRLEVEIEGSLAALEVWLDRERIVQVLTNLIGNAIKFTPAGGSITVRAERAADEVRLSIQDTGPGIPREDLARLFDRFWQARKTARLGTGLGLFIAKEIIEAHGGRIWVESELGAGSTFLVALPLSPPAP